MRKALSSLVSVSLAASFAFGCASDPGASGAAGSDAPGATPATPGAEADFDALCSAQFDAMRARALKCGPELMSEVPAAFHKDQFVAFCKVQSARPGSGYTAAFRAKCTEVMADRPCSDESALVAACAEPRGQLPHGSACSTDDQCSEGLCHLVKGTQQGAGCGTCDTPNWKQAFKACNGDKDKCEDSMECSDALRSTAVCIPRLESARGDVGDLMGDVGCKRGLGNKLTGSASVERECTRGNVPTRINLGGSCGKEGTECEPGSWCEGGKCTAQCSDWAPANSTKACVVRPALDCH